MPTLILIGADVRKLLKGQSIDTEGANRIAFGPHITISLLKEMIVERERDLINQKYEENEKEGGMG